MFGFKRSIIQAVIILSWTLKYYTFGSTILFSVVTVLLAVAVFLAITTYDHDYWTSRGIYSPPAWPIVGHILSVVLFKEQGGICFKRIYDTHRDKKFLGTHQFYQRTLVIRDPGLIKQICVNDFQYFVDRGFFFNKDVDPLAGSVLFLRGNEWRRLRAKISPIFSPNKLRGMFPLIDKTANDFVTRVKELLTTASADTSARVKQQNVTNNSESNEYSTKEKTSKQLSFTESSINMSSEGAMKCTVSNISKDDEDHLNNNLPSRSCCDEISETNKTINYQQNTDKHMIKEVSAVVDSEKLVGGYTADAIVPCAFGIKSGVMYNHNDPFAVALQAFYEMSPYNIFEKTMRQFWPAFVLFFRMRIIPKKTHDFFFNIVTSVLRAREKGQQEKRGDFIDMMMALRSDSNDSNKNKTSEEDVEITDMVISANAFIIFLGGFETTSSTLAFLCLELAAHPAVQDKMRAEIEEILQKQDGYISYEVLQELSYMEMVIQETLRLYPPFPSIQRMCTRDYTIPGTSITVEKGTIVLFPTLGIQRDEQFFENAASFIPERWAEGRPQAPPGVYMPFGDGPRYCIGKRFAMIQMKCCLIRLLRHVRLSPANTAKFAERLAEPFAADPRSPLTLHPADALINITLL